MANTNPTWKQSLDDGVAIPAMPLVLIDDATWSRQYQRTLLHYYVDSGAGGIAAGVHTTQFAIREPKHNLYKPVLEFVSQTLDELAPDNFVRVAGICGKTQQATSEAQTAANAGYHAGLLSLTAMKDEAEDAIVAHVREVASIIPVFGFYLQPTIGGCLLPYSFWQKFCLIENITAIKVAPFNRYHTWDVVRAVMESGREDIALYTGNDDNIINDLLTPFTYQGQTRYIVGGLLGQWAVWTKAAVEMLNAIKSARKHEKLPIDWLSKNMALTDANAILFDAAHDFHGCIPGLLEVLRRQGLVPTNRCLDPNEILSPGQAQEIDRIYQAYPDLTDDAFVRKNLPKWLPN
jgi:dihydrodipicolinate synthase/N-acetylneuraminate lyase